MGQKEKLNCHVMAAGVSVYPAGASQTAWPSESSSTGAGWLAWGRGHTYAPSTAGSS